MRLARLHTTAYAEVVSSYPHLEHRNILPHDDQYAADLAILCTSAPLPPVLSEEDGDTNTPFRRYLHPLSIHSTGNKIDSAVNGFITMFHRDTQ